MQSAGYLTSFANSFHTANPGRERKGDSVDLTILIPLLVLGLISLFALYLLPKIWRWEADIQRPEATEKWWPFGAALREGFVRGLPTGILAANALTVVGVLTLVEAGAT